MNLAAFLITVFTISLSGVLAPGPVTTAAIALGSRNKFAGLFIGIGHVIIELPVIIILIFGVGGFIENKWFQIIVGFLGGFVLIVMAVQLFLAIKKLQPRQPTAPAASPVITGIILSISNPYFLLWWAAVGLTLVTQAKKLGFWALILFALVHWLCDCVWLEILSYASFKGTKLFGLKGQKIMLSICALALLFFGGVFIFKTTQFFLNT